jgi:hypothetical protein
MYPVGYFTVPVGRLDCIHHTIPFPVLSVDPTVKQLYWQTYCCSFVPTAVATPLRERTRGRVGMHERTADIRRAVLILCHSSTQLGITSSVERFKHAQIFPRPSLCRVW